MNPVERACYCGLLVAGAVLALFGLFFLPLRFDGVWLPDLGGLPFPITVVLTGFGLRWLVSAAGRLTSRPGIAGGPMYVWVACLVVFVVVAPGGDRVVIADWRTLALLAAGVLPATEKLGRMIATQGLEPSGSSGGARGVGADSARG